jgi:hypothetical protein
MVHFIVVSAARAPGTATPAMGTSNNAIHKAFLVMTSSFVVVKTHCRHGLVNIACAGHARRVNSTKPGDSGPAWRAFNACRCAPARG